MKTEFSLIPTLMLALGLGAGCARYQKPSQEDPARRVAFNGENLQGWREPAGNWEVVGGVALDPKDAKHFEAAPGLGVLVNGSQGPTKNLVSTFEHGDVEAHIEFCVPKDSNSGVYFQGRYEVQVFDSFGVAKPKYSDGGGIYERWKDDKGFEGHAPRVNASKGSGEWQTYDVVFRAPRFNEFGTKTENAKFISVKHNGVLIHENVGVTGPTRAALDETSEAAHGPLILQGDHGAVAYRNIIIRDVMLP